jgi:hypothetical protein
LAAAAIAVATLSACGGSSTIAPSSAALNASYVGRTLRVNGRPVTAARLNPLPSYAGLAPNKAKAKSYEFIFNYYGTYASIFDYPKSTSQIGEITGAGGQGCTNVLYGYGKKIIWNAGRTGNVMTEYKIPSFKVLKTLPIAYKYTSSCAMDTSGDLAVGVLDGNSGGGGQVVIYKDATGTPTVYNTPLDEEFFDGYDSSGNLFADGFRSSRFSLVELPKGSSNFVTVTTSNSPEFPGSVQWDGTYMTVFDQDTAETYRYSVSGTTATLKNTVTYDGASDCAQTWIVNGLLYCGDAGNDDGEVFSYPAGGSAIATLSGSFDFPLGVTAAQK